MDFASKTYNHIAQLFKSEQIKIDTGKKLIERLYLRIHLLEISVINKTDFENNESEILKIKTIQELSKLQPVVEQMEKSFINSNTNFLQETK